MNHSNQNSVLVHCSPRRADMRLVIIFKIRLIMNHAKNPVPVCFSLQMEGFQSGYMLEE
jgi:hypothetical protein